MIFLLNESLHVFEVFEHLLFSIFFIFLVKNCVNLLLNTLSSNLSFKWYFSFFHTFLLPFLDFILQYFDECLSNLFSFCWCNLIFIFRHFVHKSFQLILFILLFVVKHFFLFSFSFFDLECNIHSNGSLIDKTDVGLWQFTWYLFESAIKLRY